MVFFLPLKSHYFYLGVFWKENMRHLFLLEVRAVYVKVAYFIFQKLPKLLYLLLSS